MKFLIVGLGNVGLEYNNTRHNIGFDIADHLANSKETEYENVKLGQMSQFRYAGKQIYVLKPNTYMNLSGKALLYWKNELSIPLERVLVLVDDLALPLGQLRLRRKGSSAGHNGLEHIQNTLGHHKYNRLRFGIGDDFRPGRQVEFVLGKWKESELPIVNGAILRASEAVLSFVKNGMDNTMNKFNTNI